MSQNKALYYRAVEYCRQNVNSIARSMALSPDGQVLCFDGDVVANLDMSPARDFKENGLFVVRSLRGNMVSAIALSEIVSDRHATVVVYDYCLSVCSDFFLIASEQTYVVKGSLVAWDHGDNQYASPYCTKLQWTAAYDGGPNKLRRVLCQVSGNTAVYARLSSAQAHFYRQRIANQQWVPPPDSIHVRKIVNNIYAEAAHYGRIAWALNPRYHSRLFRTRVVYEAYPESQDEVDEIVDRLPLKIRVVCDP